VNDCFAQLLENSIWKALCVYSFDKQCPQ
jgi:hypothetical protein